MGTLSEELLKLGLISPEKHALHIDEERAWEERGIQKQISRLTEKSRRLSDMDRIEHVATVSDFRQAALRVLEERPDAIIEVIGLAHQLKEQPGGERLVWLMYQIQDGLSKLPAEEYPRFLKQSLCEAGSTMESPQS